MAASYHAKSACLLMCWICFFGLSRVVFAADKPVQDITPVVSSAVANASPIKSVSDASKILARPVFLRGVLGGVQMQMYLHPHVDYEDSVQGDYFLFGTSVKILLAGELQGDELLMEESINGSDVSGQWSGRLEGNAFHGTWYSDDQSRSQPFELTVSESIAPNPSVGSHNKAHRD